MRDDWRALRRAGTSFWLHELARATSHVELARHSVRASWRVRAAWHVELAARAGRARALSWLCEQARRAGSATWPCEMAWRGEVT